MEAEDIPHLDKRKIDGEWWNFFSRKPMGRILGVGLSPFSLAYGSAGLARRKLYSSGIIPSRRLPCKVISVGNLTVGGTGKTPAVISIARTLMAEGVRTAVISRGYRGKYTSRTAIVSDGESVLMGPREAGDEPYMMAGALPAVPVIVGRDRYSAGMLAWERFSVQAVILDDGYQQLGLVKDLNILLINWRSTPRELRLFPLGGLREPLSQARRADVVLYTMCPEEGGGRPPFAPPEEIPAFRSRLVVTGLRRLADQALLPPEEAEGKSALAFCGIARPGSFLNTLREAGVSLVDFVTYPDHHHFTSGDLAELAQRAARAGAEMMITTEKDAVKIERHAGGAPPLYALTVELTLLDNADEWEWYLTAGIGG